MTAIDKRYYHKQGGAGYSTITAQVPASDLLKRIAYRHQPLARPTPKPERAPPRNLKHSDQVIVDVLVRKYRGESFRVLADELGVSVEQVMRWFDGVNRSRLTLEAERIYRNSLRIS